MLTKRIKTLDQLDKIECVNLEIEIKDSESNNNQISSIQLAGQDQEHSLNATASKKKLYQNLEKIANLKKDQEIERLQIENDRLQKDVISLNKKIDQLQQNLGLLSEASKNIQFENDQLKEFNKSTKECDFSFNIALEKNCDVELSESIKDDYSTKNILYLRIKSKYEKLLNQYQNTLNSLHEVSSLTPIVRSSFLHNLKFDSEPELINSMVLNLKLKSLYSLKDQQLMISEEKGAFLEKTCEELKKKILDQENEINKLHYMLEESNKNRNTLQTKLDLAQSAPIDVSQIVQISSTDNASEYISPELLGEILQNIGDILNRANEMQNNCIDANSLINQKNFYIELLMVMDTIFNVREKSWKIQEKLYDEQLKFLKNNTDTAKVFKKNLLVSVNSLLQEARNRKGVDKSQSFIKLLCENEQHLNKISVLNSHVLELENGIEEIRVDNFRAIETLKELKKNQDIVLQQVSNVIHNLKSKIHVVDERLPTPQETEISFNRKYILNLLESTRNCLAISQPQIKNTNQSLDDLNEHFLTQLLQFKFIFKLSFFFFRCLFGYGKSKNVKNLIEKKTF